ncbi:hypothetical protein HMPREF9137_1661 [Prevotella denticola F0289]|nr:hypothetical protein HMPREF9137_1661 [Prevotella denticola F0289]
MGSIILGLPFAFKFSSTLFYTFLKTFYDFLEKFEHSFYISLTVCIKREFLIHVMSPSAALFRQPSAISRTKIAKITRTDNETDG